jgi:predicted nucleic acid-binding protein
MAEAYVVDACALIAVLMDEEGSDILASKFAAALDESSGVSIFMHKLNLLEVYYDVFRRLGKVIADSVVDEVKGNPITIVSDIDDGLFKEAGRLKASYSISLADTFAVSLAKANGAKLITSDHHEFDVLEEKGEASFLWIR